MKQPLNIFSSLHIRIFIILHLILLSLGYFAYQSMNDQITKNKNIIIQAPINNITTSKNFAFIGGRVKTDMLLDTILPMSCDGHRLIRKVDQYFALPGEDKLITSTIPGNVNPSSKIPVISKQIQQPTLKIDNINIDPNIFMLTFYKSHPEYLTLSGPLPPEITQINANTFFIGKNYNMPEENNIIISYECERLPLVTAWGKVDKVNNLLTLQHSAIGSGISRLAIVEQKNKLLTQLDFSTKSLVTVCVTILTVNVLSFIKILYHLKFAPHLKSYVTSIQKVQIWLACLILFVPTQFFWSLFIGCTLLFYAGLISLTQQGSISKA